MFSERKSVTKRPNFKGVPKESSLKRKEKIERRKLRTSGRKEKSKQITGRFKRLSFSQVP
jgi:hypothetical protein